MKIMRNVPLTDQVAFGSVPSWCGLVFSCFKNVVDKEHICTHAQ